jgi:hypothetical protein
MDQKQHQHTGTPKGEEFTKKTPTRRSSQRARQKAPRPCHGSKAIPHTPKGERFLTKKQQAQRSCITERGNAAIDPIPHGSKIAINLLHQTYAHATPKSEARKRRDPIIDRKPPSYVQRREFSNKPTTSQDAHPKERGTASINPILINCDQHTPTQRTPSKTTTNKRNNRLTLMTKSEARTCHDPILDRKPSIYAQGENYT